jgi:hypothetical protein
MRCLLVVRFTGRRSSPPVLTAAAMACLLFAPAMARPDYVYTAFSDLEAVNSDGTNAWPGAAGNHAIVVYGTVINNPSDMTSDPNNWWQAYIQTTPGTYDGHTVPADDHGGAALYANNYGTYPYTTPSGTTVTWNGEFDRLSNPLDLNGNQVTLHYGDVVKVEAKAPGMFMRGKYNINEMHMADPDYDFSITVLQQNTTPAAADITLSDLKNLDGTFKFDATRNSGCEFYQASLVHLTGLTLVSTANWKQNGTVSVRQGDLTFDMLLGMDSAFDPTKPGSIDPNVLTSTPFEITAIFDQEGKDLDLNGVYDQGYRLWLTSASGLRTVPEPSGLALLAVGAAASLLRWRRRPS